MMNPNPLFLCKWLTKTLHIKRLKRFLFIQLEAAKLCDPGLLDIVNKRIVW